MVQGDGIDPIRILVENGAHVNEVDDQVGGVMTEPKDSNECQGNTPLMLACRMCNLEVCKFILDNRADVHVKDSTDMNVFMITAALGRDNILDALINCNVTLHTSSHKTCSMWRSYRRSGAFCGRR